MVVSVVDNVFCVVTLSHGGGKLKLKKEHRGVVGFVRMHVREICEALLEDGLEPDKLEVYFRQLMSDREFARQQADRIKYVGKSRVATQPDQQIPLKPAGSARPLSG